MEVGGGAAVLMKKDLERYLVSGCGTAHRSGADTQSPHPHPPPPAPLRWGGAAEGEHLFSQTGCMNYSSTRLCRIEQESA